VGACQHVIETREPLFIRQKSAENLPFRIAVIQGAKPQESFIYVPLMLRGEALGVLSIQHPQPDAYTPEDQFILELLANHVALALHNARLYRSLAQLYETGQILTQQFESADTPQTIVDSIKQATRSDIVVLYPYDMAASKFAGPPCIAGTLLKPTPHQAMYPSFPDNIALMMLEQRDAFFARESETLYTSLLEEDALLQRQRFHQREQISSTAAIPLRVEEKAVGVLFVNFRQPQHFTASQKLLIEGLAHYAAIAIKNAQTFERLSERHIHELETLQKIDSVLNMSNPELKEVLDALLKLAHEQVPADSPSILLYDPHKKTFAFGATRGSLTPAKMALALNSLEKGIIRWVVDHKRTAIVNNVHTDPRWCDIYRQGIEETISELDVPLLDEDKVIGVLNFESATQAAFRQEDALFLETLAGQAVLAIKKAQAYEREKRFAERFRLLYEAGRELGKITETRQIDTAYQTIIRLAQELSQSAVVLRRFNEETRELLLVCSSPPRYSPPTAKIGIGEKFNGRVARELHTLVIDDISQWPPESRPADPTIQSLLITPVTFKDRYYGNLELTHEEIAHFQDKDQEFFAGLVQQLASTLYRLEITQERQELTQRARAAETMISIGQATYEITHRIGNDLGLVGSCVSHIKANLQSPGISNVFIDDKLHYIEKAVNKVMALSESLRAELGNWKDSDRFVLLPPAVLLEEVLQAVPIPDTIEVRMEVAANVAPVRVIHQLFANTLRNLVTNAKEAMPDGGRLTLRVRNRGRSVIFQVIDSGVGIPAEHQAHIFDLFFSTKEHGSGFGLWSAQRNALKNRGKLEVSSEVNKGTTFTLLLPKAEENSV
jgi:GAF domain-containing protein